jgi:peroxiredoxin Q/BCP
MLEIGSPAPEFRLPAHDGSTVSLADLRGQRVLLWFYPKADTPG